MRSMKNEARGKRPRRAFTAEFKAGAVRLVLDEGKSMARFGLAMSAASRADTLFDGIGAPACLVGVSRWSPRSRRRDPDTDSPDRRCVGAGGHCVSCVRRPHVAHW